MSRNTGTFNFAANFEVLAKAPLDAKQLVGTKADLTGATTWNQSGGVWLYDGAIVSVGSDPIPENNGIYFLASATTYTDINSWIKAGTGEGGGTITGGTNGLSTSGANIVLGGDLVSGTTINAANNDFFITNITDFQVKTSGDTVIFGIDETGLLVSFLSGETVSFDNSGGLQYGGDYSSGYTEQSIPDVNFVTGLTSSKLNISTFSGYTGTTKPIIDAALTGASNGLDFSNRVVSLGGSLTGDTTIDGLNIHKLNLNNLSDFQITSSGGTSVSLNSPEGLIYGSGYTSGNPYWIPTKLYVDSVAIGLNVHPATWVASTTDLSLSGLTTVDGVLLQNGDRVLVKSQTDDTENGIYDATGGTWQRSADYNFSPLGEIANGDLIPVTSGVTLSNSLWAVTSPNPIVSGDSVQFTLFSRPIQYIGGTGINVALNTISVDGASLIGNSLKWTGNTFNVDITTGTLSTALTSKLNITTFTGYTATTSTLINSKLAATIFTGYTASTAAVIDNAITGVTYAGSGTTLYSGTTGLSGRTLVLNTIIGSGGTTVQKVGDEIIVSSLDSTGSQEYSGETPSAVNLCGITIGYQLTGKTVSCIIQDLLVPELCGTVTALSLGIGLTATGLYEIGCSVSQTVTGTFNQGCINPQYCSISDKRSGLPNAYCFTGTGMPAGFQACTNLVAANTNASYGVLIGTNSWGVCTRYDAGSPALGSKGTQYCAALVSGCTALSSASLCGVYPLWATCVDITIPLEKIVPLYNMPTANNVCLILVNETPSDKQKFEIPCAWLGAPTSRPLTGVCLWNSVGGSWEWQGGSAGASLTYWTPSSATETVQSNSIGYCQYTYNGPQRGTVCIRLVF